MCQDKHKVFSKDWWTDLDLFTEIKNVPGNRLWDLTKEGINFDELRPRDIIEFEVMGYGGGRDRARQRIDKIFKSPEFTGHPYIETHDIRDGKDFPEKKDRWHKVDIEKEYLKSTPGGKKGPNYLTEAILPDDERKEVVGEFIKFCFKKLQINSRDFNIKLSKNLDHVKEIKSFGTFEPSSKDIWVYWGDGRNIADVCRTIGHELVHRKQDEEGKIKTESGNDGTEIENEANSMAGVLLREFGRIESRIYG